MLVPLHSFWLASPYLLSVVCCIVIFQCQWVTARAGGWNQAASSWAESLGCSLWSQQKCPNPHLKILALQDLLWNIPSKLLLDDLCKDWMCALEKHSRKRDWKNWKSKFFKQSHCYGPAGTSVLKDGSPASIALGLVTVDFWWVKNADREEGAEVGTLWWTEQQTSGLYPPSQPHSQ